MKARLIAWLAVGVVLLACGGETQQGSGAPEITHAEATRDVVDGAAGVTTTVQVKFDRAVELASSRVPLASHFEISVPSATGGEQRRVLVQSAELTEAGRGATLHVNSLVPTGSTLLVAREAFALGETGTVSAVLESDLALELAVLAQATLAIGREELLDTPRVPEATNADWDPAAVRAQLEAHFAARGATAEVTKRALETYDGMPRNRVPAPKARAAIALLTGTFAETAVRSLLTEDNCTGRPAGLVAFQSPPGAPNLLARVTHARDGSRTLSLNPSVEGERIEHLAVLIAHEAIHCDDEDGRYEEVAATAIDAFLYLHLLAVDPELAVTGTRLAREYNIDAVALINSGRRIPESVGVLKSPSVERVLPGSNATFASFGDLVVASYPEITINDSPNEPVAQAYVAVLAAAIEMPVNSAFDLRYLDELLGRAMDPAVLAAAIEAFGLIPLD